MFREMSIFSGNAHPELALNICRHLEVPLGECEVFEFSNENIFVRICENVRERDVFVIQPIASPVNTRLMELLIMIDAFRRASAGRITAVIPYFAYGRSDKKDQPRIPITARLVADMITTAGADRVLTIDLHASQIQGFFRIPVDELTAFPSIGDYFKGPGPRQPRRRRARPGARQGRPQHRRQAERAAGHRRKAAHRQHPARRSAPDHR